MKSFGIWYCNAETRAGKANSESKPFKIDLHINLWDTGYNYGSASDSFIDIGLSVAGFREIDMLCFRIPFFLNEKEITDLTDTFDDNQIANLVFNDDCILHHDSNKRSLELSEKKEQLLLFSLSEAVQNYQEDATILTFNLKTVCDDSIYDEYSDLYIRFRISSEKIREELFCNITAKNWFLESGFQRTQVVDIKVNKQRNMESKVLTQMRREGFWFVNFNKVHFLVMEPADNEVDVWGDDFVECRKLEDEWAKYLKCEGVGDILAYHWKAGAAKGLKEYAKMVKVTSAETNWRIISIYMVVVIILGAFGSALFSLAQVIFGKLW